MTKTLFFLLALVALVVAEKARYDQYQVYRMIPKTRDEVVAIRSLKDLTTEFSFWTEPSMVNRPVMIMVPPHKRPMFNDFITSSGIDTNLQIDNVQSLIDTEEEKMKMRPKAIGWTDYYPLEDIYGWLDELAASNPNVTVVVGGTTYEGREIRGIEIKNGNGLPGVIFESGIHAREWIGPAASSWIVNQILNSEPNSLWRQFNYLYFPNTNPDGYVYTWTDDRMFRKTRKPYRVGGIITCYGADPNRNWDYHWNEGGASNNPCAEDYHGPNAFSEVETESLAAYWTKVAPNYDIHIAFHSFSQLIMFPWGYTQTHTPLHNTWQRIGDLAAAALKAVHGKIYDVGNIYETIYQTSGTSTEWYYGKFNATLAYTNELRDTGDYGFILPADQIIPTAEEMIAAIQVMLTEYQKL